MTSYHGASTRMLPFARAVALALIAVLVAGLAYLRFGTGDSPVVVPEGAEAGELFLEPCSYATEDGSYEADCGTLVVPENRADPASRLIALPVTRIHARSGAGNVPIFRLQGGPGLTNMVFREGSRFADDQDVVLVGYRGVDGSSVLDCPEVVSALKHSSDLVSEGTFRAHGSAFRACANRLSEDGVDLEGYSLVQRVDDLEAARTALGYDGIDLLSESVGTRTAMVYSWRYPSSIHRSVMVGANPPGNFVWDPTVTDEQLTRYAELCAQDETCDARTEDLVASMERVAQDIPDRWWFLPIKAGNVRAASFYMAMETTGEPPLNAPMVLDTWLAASHGDASGLWFMSFAADVFFPASFVWGDVAVVGLEDTQRATDYYDTGGDPGSVFGNAATDFIWGGGHLADWPAAPDTGDYSEVRTSEVETLVISGSLDLATPPQIAAQELLPHLPNGHQVVLEGLGHTFDFWTIQPEASTQLVAAFFDRGEVDDSRYAPVELDFTPEVSHTALAKGFVGTMLGLGLLTVISLLWMALVVVRRGQLGRTAGAIVRSMYAVVLGLGGWFLGALTVLATMPSVPLDDPRLAVLAIGAPIGMAVYLAWLHRDWATSRRTIGLAAAGAGAFVGAWLGFHATVDLLALVTAIAGAIAGSNLAVIIFDMATARSARGSDATDWTMTTWTPDLAPVAT